MADLVEGEVNLEQGFTLQFKADNLKNQPDVAAAIQASIAISLKRIADALTECDKYGQTGSAAIAQAIVDGFRESKPF